MSSTDTVSASGHLFKKSEWLKKWRKRHFVLENSKLTFAGKEGKDPHGIINLSRCLAVEPADEQTKKEHSFEISINEQDKALSFFLFATSEEEKQDWMDKISLRLIGKGACISLATGEGGARQFFFISECSDEGRLCVMMGGETRFFTFKELEQSDIMRCGSRAQMGLHLETRASSPISLWFQGKSLTGTIPIELGNCSLLSVLNLGGNKFSGSIPRQLGNCTALKELYLYENQLTGTIPVELGQLILLQKLYLDRNQLSGELPTELQNLSALQILRIDNNDLDDPEECKGILKKKLPKCDVGAFTKHSNHKRLLSHLAKQN